MAQIDDEGLRLLRAVATAADAWDKCGGEFECALSDAVAAWNDWEQREAERETEDAEQAALDEQADRAALEDLQHEALNRRYRRAKARMGRILSRLKPVQDELDDLRRQLCECEQRWYEALAQGGFR